MGFPLTRDDFPAHIAPVMADKLPELKRHFAGGGAHFYNARENYIRLSSQIAFLTGNEYARDRQGRHYTRQEWEDVMHKCLTHLNDELMLGLDDTALEVFTLCYTMLAEATRFGGDPIIVREHGESTGVHSLHTMLQAQYIYQSAQEENPELAGDIDFFRNFQMTCLMLSMHDFGEVLGEAGSLAMAADAGNWAVKDKAAFERSVFDFAVRLAVQVVTDKRPREEFYNRVDAVKRMMKIQNQGLNKTDAELAAELADNLNEKIHLSNSGETLFQFLKKTWEWVEEPEKSAYPFLGYLATNCERMQGTRHLVRHLAESPGSPVELEDGNIGLIKTVSLSPGYRITANAQYVEGKLGLMCAAMDPAIHTREYAIARQTVRRAYETQVDLFRYMPAAFFTGKAPISETRLHNDGTPFTVPEVSSRKKEIRLAADIATMEAGMLTSSFNESSLAIGRTAVTMEQVVGLYRRAIETKYLPFMIEADGKKRGEILVIDRPRWLTNQPVPTPEKISVIEESVRQKVLDYKP